MTKRSRLALGAATIVTITIAIVAGHDVGSPVEHDTPAAREARHATDDRPGLASTGASIAGTIRDDRGISLAAARVCARVTEAMPRPDCTQTDARGTYHLDLSPGAVEIWASARGRVAEAYAPAFRLGDGEHRDDVDLVLHGGGVELHGTITRQAGEPVAHARVVVHGVMAETDDTGHYSMWLRPGWVLARVSADGYASVDRIGDAPAQLDAVLSVGATLRGTVVDVAGAPVAGATVVASHTDTVRDVSVADVQPVVSDDRGRFAVTGLAPGRYAITARAAHGYGLAAEVPLAPGRAVEGIVVRLSPGAELVGHVMTPAGEACADSALWLEDDRGRGITTTSDLNGALHAGGLAPGTYRVQPICVGYRALPHYDAIAITDRDVDVMWPTTDGAAIRGRVATRHGRPVVDVSVYASGIGPKARDPAVNLAVATTATGEFTIRGLPPGHYDVTAKTWPSDASPAKMTVAIDIHDTEVVTHDFVVDDDVGAIAGTVVDTTGQALRKVTVSIKGDSDDTAIARVDDAGSFTADGLVPGNYRLTVRADDGELAIAGAPEGAVVEIRVGDTAKPHLVVAVPRGVIRGRVIDDRGAAVAGALVSLTTERGDRSYHWESDSQLPTDADGRFVASHLSASTYHIRAFRRDGMETVVRDVPIGGDITLVLPAPATIVGVAHRRAGNVGDLEIRIIDRVDDALVRSQTFSGTNGHFEVVDVPPGLYQIVIDADDSQATTEVAIVSGQRAELDVALAELVTVVGRVVDARTGQPIGGVVMSASRLDNTAYNLSHLGDVGSTSDVDGRFTLTGVPRGRVLVTGRAIHDSPQFAWIEVQRDAADDVTDFGDIPIMSSAGDLSGNCDCNIVVKGDVAAVEDVVKDGAADLAGIVAGDVITSIDGIDVTGQDAERAAMLVHGPMGSSIELTMQRGITATLVRR